MGSLDARADKMLTWLKRVREVLKTFGLWGRVEAAVTVGVTVAWGVLLRWLGQLPVWLAIIAGLATAILVVHLATAFWKAWLLRGVKSLDIAQLGRNCVQLGAAMLEFLATRRETAPSRYAPMVGDQEAVSRALHEAWAQGVHYSQQTEAKLAEKFAPLVISLSHLLRLASIKPPDLWAFNVHAGSIAAYLGAVGDLLERGLLDEARRLDPQEIVRLHLMVG